MNTTELYDAVTRIGVTKNGEHRSQNDINADQFYLIQAWKTNHLFTNYAVDISDDACEVIYEYAVKISSNRVAFNEIERNFADLCKLR